MQGSNSQSELRAYIVSNEDLAALLAEAHPELQLGLGSCLVGRLVLDGEWLDVAGVLVPLLVGDTPALQELAEAEIYVVTNSELRAEANGIRYRSAPSWDTEKKLTLAADYGSLVAGVPYNHEWLQVGELYLPMRLNGCLVLRPRTPPRAAPKGLPNLLRGGLRAAFAPKIRQSPEVAPARQRGQALETELQDF